MTRPARASHRRLLGPMRGTLGHLLLALVLLASQALGLSHAVRHGVPAAAAGVDQTRLDASGQPVRFDASGQPAGADQGGRLAAADHSGHAPGSPLCQLLGHLGLADGAPSAPPLAPLRAAATHAAPTWLAAALPGRPAPAAYAARAPPAAA